ncbi:allophanate hydrolase [Halopseudomonas pelagia]|uniref:Allophanate hydrolase n=1 Tax=Halopseudomonas pelagia TaxID=553151 RepID=A0AA92IKW5_9GAMM|nr:allophanate hydrolase [Halopseudomonas pelagia]PCD00014.1 allophanate hydrolase [Halopseudomonas pelagia]QFY58221.1 allophanate hydrolase [Halopseudomonas pelagia]
MAEQCGWTISEWQQAYQNGLEPQAALTQLLAEFSADDPAFIHIVAAAELSTQLAHLATLPDAQQLPLYGIPCVVKDNIDVAGLPTTAACPAYGYIADQDAHCVALLRAAGAIVLAKANLDQFATGLVGTRSPYGAVPNSFDPEYISGGSSSGSSVSVARGLVPFSLGTDTAGSGRVPAGFNNLVGLKPTRGRFSTRGVVPACRSLDCVSIFALNIDDAETVANVMESFDAADGYSRVAPPSARLIGTQPRLGIPASLPWFGDSQAEAAWQASLTQMREMGAQLIELDFTPMQQLAELLYGGPWVAERYAAIAEFMDANGDQMNPVVRGILANAEKFSATDTYRAEYRRADLAREIQTLVQSVDALLVPTAPRMPTTAQVEQDPVTVNSQLGTWTNFVNLADCSALALPAGFRQDGLPFGITLIGSAWQDRALADFGRRWQAFAPWKAGATDRNLPAPSVVNAPAGHVRLAVVGAHLSGMPLNTQLTERHARFVESTLSADNYRLYALPNTTPPKPGLIRSAEGAAIAVELWDVPVELFGSFVALVPAPLGIGTLTLQDGREVKGFICEGAAVEGATDITHLGGWRAYIASRN